MSNKHIKLIGFSFTIFIYMTSIYFGIRTLIGANYKYEALGLNMIGNALLFATFLLTKDDK